MRVLWQARGNRKGTIGDVQGMGDSDCRDDPSMEPLLRHKIACSPTKLPIASSDISTRVTLIHVSGQADHGDSMASTFLAWKVTGRVGKQKNQCSVLLGWVVRYVRHD